jgi:16S rRNA (cytidine1402-2'-O)-methyltransferase
VTSGRHQGDRKAGCAGSAPGNGWRRASKEPSKAQAQEQVACERGASAPATAFEAATDAAPPRETVSAGISDAVSEAILEPATLDRARLERHAPGLHLVATPIGNAADITLRALGVLRAANLIACEDTRVTGKLMALFGISTPRLAYNDHNGDRIRPLLLERLRGGEMIALVSDAGTPLVSDPGFKLVRAAIAEEVPVTIIPGASAPIAALALSGLPSDRFFFAGFLPGKAAQRRRELVALREVPGTLIFFEAARRLEEALGDMLEMLGDRPAAVARELTKLFEEVRRGMLSDLVGYYRCAGPPKGEIVLLVGPPEAGTRMEAAAAGLDEKLRAALGGASLKDASAAIAAELGLPRRQVYARALTLAAGMSSAAEPSSGEEG